MNIFITLGSEPSKRYLIDFALSTNSCSLLTENSDHTSRMHFKRLYKYCLNYNIGHDKSTNNTL